MSYSMSFGVGTQLSLWLMVDRRDSPSGVCVCDVGKRKVYKIKRKIQSGQKVFGWTTNTALSKIP
jgi:hypothetical protein